MSKARTKHSIHKTREWPRLRRSQWVIVGGERAFIERVHIDGTATIKFPRRKRQHGRMIRYRIPQTEISTDGYEQNMADSD